MGHNFGTVYAEEDLTSRYPPEIPEGEDLECQYRGDILLEWDFELGAVISGVREPPTVDWSCHAYTAATCLPNCVDSETQAGSGWNMKLTTDGLSGELNLQLTICCGPCKGGELGTATSWRRHFGGDQLVTQARDFIRNLFWDLTTGPDPGSISNATLIIIRTQLINLLETMGMIPEENLDCEKIKAMCRGEMEMAD